MSIYEQASPVADEQVDLHVAWAVWNTYGGHSTYLREPLPDDAAFIFIDQPIWLLLYFKGAGN